MLLNLNTFLFSIITKNWQESTWNRKIFSLLTSRERVSNLHRKYCHLLILQSLDWFAAFHLELLQAILFIASVWGCQLSSIGRLPSWRIGERSLDIEDTGEIKYPERTWKLTYGGIPRGNQNLSRSGNCKWEAALAKLTIGGDEANRYSYRSETDRRRWEPSCRLSHCNVEGKVKPSHHDLKAATKVLWWSNSVIDVNNHRDFIGKIQCTGT